MQKFSAKSRHVYKSTLKDLKQHSSLKFETSSARSARPGRPVRRAGGHGLFFKI
jgi:hypothetical protein